MLHLAGKPLLQHWIELLKKYGINDIAINLYYLGEQIENYFGNGEKFNVGIKYSRQEKLLGQAAAIKRIEQLYPGFCSEPFLVIYADNLTDMDIGKVVDFHKRYKPIVTITLHEHDEPWTRGIVQTDETGRVLSFVEKPDKELVLSGKFGENPGSAGCVYVFEPEVLRNIEYDDENLGKELFPKLLNRGYKLCAFNPRAYLLDIGTIERYEKAKKDIEEGVVRLE
jgi:NDP-sugar pyrophosphorylase family protein